MTVTFHETSPGARLAPGSRVRSVWRLNALGEIAAGLSFSHDSTDTLSVAAQAIIAGVSSRQIGYVTNVPPAIAPGDLGVVLDIRLRSTGNGMTAGELASMLADLSSRVNLTRLGPVPTGETAAMALAARESQTQAATAQASAALPSGVLAGAADSVGQGARNLVTAIKWGGIILLVLVGFWAWRTYGPRG